VDRKRAKTNIMQTATQNEMPQKFVEIRVSKMISLISERIFKNPFGFWKRNERAKLYIDKFFLQAKYNVKRDVDGKEKFDRIFVIFHEFQYRLSQER
jgi:hypothetical protein